MYWSDKGQLRHNCRARNSNLNKALYVDLQQEPCHLEVGAEEEVWEGAVDAGEGEGLPHKEIKGHLKLL